ncbi:MAG: SAM-dependent chlorinase/fluorinase [Pseudodesulfovibrio sp.]
MFTPKKDTPPPRTIGLLTDFGLADPYVGQMKAVLAKKAPHCPVVDISHGVTPYNVAQAAFFLAASHPHFAKDAIIVAVVDPGVGTKRKIVALQVDDQILIAPDNGLLSLVNNPDHAIRAFDLSAAMTGPKNISPTFHGRDVFAPLGAWIAMGGQPSELGKKIAPEDLITLPWSQPDFQPGHATAHVLHIDRFGNCVLNLLPGSLGETPSVRLPSLSSDHLACVVTYGELCTGEAGLLDGSQGFMEIAVNQHSAADKFGLALGDQIELNWEA